MKQNPLNMMPNNEWEYVYIWGVVTYVIHKL